MASNVIRLPIELTEKGNLNKTIKQSNKSVENLNKSVKKVNDNTKKVNSSFTRVNSSISSVLKTVGGLSLAFAGLTGIQAAVDNLIEFDTALTEINTIIPESAKRNFNLADSLIAVSNQFGKSPKEEANSFYQIISAGITDAASANKVLIASNKLAIGGLTSTTVAVDAITNAINVYGSENISASKAADVLFASVRLGKTRVEELASSISQATPTARALGISFETTAGAVAALTTKGNSTSEAVTKLNSIFVGVLKNQARAKKILGDNAEAFSIQALKTKGLTKFLQDLNVAIGGSEEKLVQLFGRQEAATGFLSLASDGFKSLDETIQGVSSSAGEADTAFAKISNTIGFQLTKLRTNLSNLVLKISSGNSGIILDIIKRINQELVNLENGTSKVALAIQSTLITIGVIAFTTFANRARLSILSIVTQFKAFRAQAAASMSGASVSFLAFIKTTKLAKIAVASFKAAATLGLSLVLDAIIYKVLELKEEFGGFRKVFEFFALKAKIAFEKVKIAIAEVQLKILEVRKGVDEFVQKGLSRLFGTKTNLADFSDSFKKINDKIKDSTDNIQKLGREILKLPSKKNIEVETTSNVIPGSPVTEESTSTSGEQATSGSSVASQANSTIVGLVGQFVTSMTKGAKGAADALAAGLGAVADYFLPGIGGAVQAIVSLLAQGPDKVRETIRGFFKAIPDVIEAIIESLPVLLEEMAVGMSDVMVRIAEKADVIIENFIKAMIKAAPRIITSLVTRMPRVALALAKNMPSAAVKFVTALVKEAPRFITELIKEIAGSLGDIGGGLLGGIGDIGGGIGGFIGDAVGFVGDAIGSVGSFVGGLFAEGGIGRVQRVPSGFPNDTFPARLTSGELVIDRSTTQELQSFLRRQSFNQGSTGQSDSSSINTALLTKIISLLEQPLDVSSSVQFNQREFANILLTLERTNARTA